MSKKIYLVRHCKAEGQSPEAPLTKEGHLDAKRLAQYLSNKDIDEIYCSPFLRAQQTILPLSHETGIPIHADRRLSEKVLSTCDLPDWIEKLRRSFDDMTLKFEGGESSLEATKRAVSCMDNILKSNRETYVVVTHGCLMALILKHYDSSFGSKEWEKLTNPDIYQLSFDEHMQSKITQVWHEKSLL
ncbi:histidine phosphatase family protein [Scopulibacillus cellulosilyticus]|uniref:Histidine phosphatase family protein n=1 Tax=Scopulibacillus cellulosilyticus TaxID=2665665 RepID=A0ABW2PU69_9BACL